MVVRFFCIEILLFVFLSSCVSDPGQEPSAREKIAFSLERLDEDGLLGPKDGKRALTYEFCIPPDKVNEVAAIDRTAQFMHAPGRVGCTGDLLLCLGHTHQPEFRRILHRLAGLAYVREIREAHFE